MNSNIKIDDLLIPAYLRLKFEQELELSAKKSVKPKHLFFKDIFKKTIKSYYNHICETMVKVLAIENNSLNWFQENDVDIITWHYKTRHLAEGTTENREWFAGQLAINSSFKTDVINEEYLPYKTESPYIDIFAKEKPNLSNVMEIIPTIIFLPKEMSEINSEHNNSSFPIPPDVTKILIEFPPPRDYQPYPLEIKDLNEVKNIDSDFILKLKKWMGEKTGKKVGELDSLNYLCASLKVTLSLLKKKLESRSTFLCPTYVGGKKVGGMAFACKGLVKKETAIIGEAVSTNILTYLRLREDELAQRIIEEIDALDQVKRFFVHRLSHNFRHPINALQSSVRELKESSAHTTETKDTLTKIAEQIEYFDDIMEKTLLAIEGKDVNKILNPQKVSDEVFEFIDDLRYYFKRQFLEKNKTLIIQEIDKSWKFKIDRGILREIMENLISNALEHGGNRVKISVEKKNNRYLLHVKDNGKGISEKDVPKMFHLQFNRVSPSKAKVRGRGLVIVKTLVEIHKGNIYYKTKEGNYYKPNGIKYNLISDAKEWTTDFVVEISEN